MKTFRIQHIIDVTLTEKELWPDGDQPENPTRQDVEKLIQRCGGTRVLFDWNLVNDGDFYVVEVEE